VSEPLPFASASIAVAIPCYNEAAALPSVLAAWRTSLPTAEIVVFDNNSTDRSGEIARGLGVRVVPVAEQGKGNVVRAVFAALADRDAIVLVDGDGTYPADHVQSLLEPVLQSTADMTVGARQPVQQAGAMTPVRGLGNVLIRGGFRTLIGPGLGDILSGYRVFGRHFRETVALRSTGFEIETELSSQALVHRLRVVEIDVPYYPRIAGTQSKLRAVRDGMRILRTILGQSVRYRRWRLLAVILLPIVLIVAIVLGLRS
jgi:glycosyltransferase involved in cell wall biosynthesis